MASLCASSSASHTALGDCRGAQFLATAFKTGELKLKDGVRRPLIKASNSTSAVMGVRSKVDEDDSIHKLIIVGGGIAGLASAAAMHKIGVKTLVLEQAPDLRTTGSSLALWKNAWHVLDVLGIGDELRSKHQKITGIRLFNQEEKLLKGFELSECPGGPHEVRGVERRLLANALASQVPEGTIRFNSRLLSIKKNSKDGTFALELSDGTVLRTKVLLGADGVNSVVAKWMGLSQTRFVGQVGFRGLAEFSASHSFVDKTTFYLGQGVRAGVIPISPTKVQWFFLWNQSSPGPKVTDPTELKKEMLVHLEGWPSFMEELLNNTPMDNLSRAVISDRWNLPGITPPLVQNGATLAGDALHPMTPNLAQGGCAALEDAVILAQTLGLVLAREGDDESSISEALEKYAAERQQRTFPLQVKAFVMGALLQVGFPPLCFVRDNFAIPQIVSPDSFLSHTFYNCGELPLPQVVTK